MTATAPFTRLVIRATEDDIASLGAMAQEFYAASEFLQNFDLETFCWFWRSMFQSGAGAIFILMEGDEPAGALGAVAHKEPYNDNRVAHEFFFFVRSRSRGGFGFMRLYGAFEDWAVKEQRCNSIHMVHLQDLTPEKLKNFYGRIGYKAAETVYVKRVK